ncbi:MAG: Wzz/FepE/Etk N-terminal domain-containing protein [Pseudomonadota bacterium]
MSNVPHNSDIPNAPESTESAGGAGRVLIGAYELPPEFRGQEISLAQLWEIVWRHKWIIFIASFLFAVASVAYALMATEWYRANTLLAPAENQGAEMLSGQFGSLAGLAGISVPSNGNGEPLAVLKSREFAREFITELNLLPVFFADQYDASSGKWIDPDPSNHPDIRDAVKLFHEQILKVSTSDDNLVQVGIEWTDPFLAANWVTTFVERLNERERQRELSDAEANLSYLQAELVETNLATIQHSIGRLMESELQKVMMARGSKEFSFRVIDSAITPKERSRPRRALIAIAGTLFGGFLGFVTALIIGLRSHYRDRDSSQTHDR